MPVTIRSIEPRIVTLPRAVPYLGPLGPGESVNAKGYVVRTGNRTIYPIVDRSVVVRITASDGTAGWGETYGSSRRRRSSRSSTMCSRRS
jgi:galactonate dehydratase